MSDVTSTTLQLTATFNSGTHSGTEHLESWTKDALASVYTRRDDIRVNGVSSLTRTLTALRPGTPLDLACRLTRSGLPALDSPGDPATTPSVVTGWPSDHKQSGILLPLDDAIVGVAIDIGHDLSGHLLFGIDIVVTPSDQNQADMDYELQLDPGSGFTSLGNAQGRPWSIVTESGLQAIQRPWWNVETYRNSAPPLQIRRKTAYTTSNWVSVGPFFFPASGEGPF